MRDERRPGLDGPGRMVKSREDWTVKFSYHRFRKALLALLVRTIGGRSSISCDVGHTHVASLAAPEPFTDERAHSRAVAHAYKRTDTAAE